jgi:hypothetical protein
VKDSGLQQYLLKGGNTLLIKALKQALDTEVVKTATRLQRRLEK